EDAADEAAQRDHGAGLGGEHAGDAPALKPEMLQHAELALAGEGLGAIAGRDAEDAEQDRDGFQGIRRGEAAIEYREGERPELAGLPPLEAREIGMEASQPRDHFPRIGMARESDRELGDVAPL